jgi:hypothetical protein
MKKSLHLTLTIIFIFTFLKNLSAAPFDSGMIPGLSRSHRDKRTNKKTSRYDRDVQDKNQLNETN